MVNAPAAGFLIPKIGNVFTCGAPARGPIIKWTLPGDSARRVGLVRYPEGLSDCSWSISKVGNTPLQDSEMRKWRMVLLVERQPGVVWQNGWDQEIQRVKKV